MAILIYKAETFEEVDAICDSIWDLPDQISELEKWLIDNSEKFTKDKCVIDIGFGIRADACGGGSVISSEMMKILSDNNFDLYLSEYPFTDDNNDFTNDTIQTSST